MNKHLPTLHGLSEALARLPGLGPKAAQRAALHILRGPRQEAEDLAGFLQGLHGKVLECGTCHSWTEEDPCWVCRDETRDTSQLCVVEEVVNVFGLEKTGAYRGRYHVLHGLLSPLDGVGPEKLRMESLFARIEGAGSSLKEVILALNPTVEGEATCRYLSLRLQKAGLQVTRIASGVPVGQDLEHVDEVTLSRSLMDRQSVSPS